MSNRIPPEARTLRIPNLGEIAVFQEESSWLAVYIHSDDGQASPTGTGETPVEAIASLLMQE